MAVKILVDSASDFTMQEVKDLDLVFMPLRVCFGEQEYKDGVELDHDQFFEKLIETDTLPTTSQLSPYAYGEYFRAVADAGDTAVCITLSSKLSGCYQSAMIAAQDYEGVIYVVDSLNASLGQRILTELGVRLRDQNLSAAEIAATLDEEKKKIRLVALLDTLEYLKKGGRISTMTALAGNILSIKPVIGLINGEVVLVGKARGSKAGNNKLTELIEKEGSFDLSKPYCLAYSGHSDHMLRKYIQDYAYLYEGKTDYLPIASIGCAIGTHIGPGAIGVTFFVE